MNRRSAAAYVASLIVVGCGGGGGADGAGAAVAARATADTDHRDWVTLYWMGHNNDTQPEQIKATYGDNFLDIRSFMVAQSDPANPDQADQIRRDLPSSNLRSDGIHLTGAGDEVVGGRIIDFIRARGW